MMVGTLVLASTAVASEGSCRATNLTQDTRGHANLQAAITAAHPGDRISVRGVCFGGFKIDKNLTLAGRQSSDGAKPVLHGEHGSGRVVDVAARVTLASLTVTGGLARAGENTRDWNGGGIIVRKGAVLTVDGSVVRGNKATNQGGGIANYGTLILIGSTSVTENVVGHRYEDGSRDGHGGGIVNYSTLRMNDSSSVRNNTGGNTGGGIVNYATLIMNDSSSVQGNMAELGGGISLDTDHPRYKDPTVTMNDASSVRGNIAVSQDDGLNGGGGGGFFFNDGSVTLKDSASVSGNRASGGGGILIGGGAALTLEDRSTVRGNTADNDDPGRPSEGGGIWSSGTVILKDSSSVTGNRATGDGGGVYNQSSIFTVDDSASVQGNATDVGEDDVGGDVSGTTTKEWLAAAVTLIWILAAIVAAFIGGPWVRAAALATFTGLIGQGPGVMVGALLGAAIIRLAGYRTESRKTWLTRWPTTNFLLTALVVSTVLVSNGQPSSAIADLVEVVELIPISAGRLTPFVLLLVLPPLLLLLIGVAAAGTAHSAGAGPRTRHRSRSHRARVDHGNT